MKDQISPVFTQQVLNIENNDNHHNLVEVDDTNVLQ
jgi:hypothetical protein